MRDVSEAFVFLQSQIRQGAYGHAATYADALPQTLRAIPIIALELARARMGQGRMTDAGRALAEADLLTGSARERLIIALEAASLRINRDVAIRPSLNDVDAVFATVNLAALDRADQAEAERIRSRILLIRGLDAGNLCHAGGRDASGAVYTAGHASDVHQRFTRRRRAYRDRAAIGRT
jgi:hypothetical protein